MDLVPVTAAGALDEEAISGMLRERLGAMSTPS